MITKYYIGENKEITDFDYENFIVKNGDEVKVSTNLTHFSVFFCEHKNGNIILHKSEVGDLRDLRLQKIKYIEQYY